MDSDQADIFVKLHDAQIKESEAQATIAGQMTDVAIKAGEAYERIQAAHLQNVAKFLDIKWDSQAHASLVRARNVALRKAAQLRSESKIVATKARELGKLLAGGSWTAVRNAWIAFDYFYGRCAAKVTFPATPPGAYESSAWLHPDHEIGEALDAAHHDPFNLFRWARTHSYFPKEGTPAFEAMQGRLAALAKAADAMASELTAGLAEAEKAALEIHKIDWDRLKET
mgnify:CR=1 FL=1